MITGNRLLTCWFLLIILLQTSHATTPCSHSTCGIISNISHPFRLRDDPKNCGDPNYELACENNVTFIYLSSLKYLVKALNYGNSTIRLADPSINDDTCSFPKHSVYAYNFTHEYPFSTYSDWIFRDENDPGVAWPVNFVSCPHRLEDSSNFTEITDCINGASNSSRGRYSYIKVGNMSGLDIGDKCGVDLIVMTSLKFKNFKNVTLSKIHDALKYGFELSWFQFRCIECKGGWECTTMDENLHRCSGATFQLKLDVQWGKALFTDLFWIALFLIIIVGLRLEAVLMITGFIYVWGLLILSNFDWFFDSGIILKVFLIVVISYAARIIIVFPCAMGLLICKFQRRRQLSKFDEISDNQPMPIRGSSLDISVQD
ncbi:LEAF RUST 10 DISEASE-RESISTANCE LOCUS RECEPTOR-LIKE PROTEIN KINASE-like 1.2 isoform X2 [Salvia miltiorrhiza]|uniref:LEAF RUST 10 DISEASE-RESISTANCE LOCUS RECEPTOR-LIKE PROTEIN KINASE-like 1.2 isoform X2 n=1 Tax=Salvia miltiorrhiza TaxID=226208 RepID=UPI0025ACDC5F|nr:LEAF RUST 10 DISEASE-RESISTANCE LOCUS RECEPTOR-LIKE PROTEIN KINASE-like 1.2 isoform X2 [Salvia miltiorrhiza]